MDADFDVRSGAQLLDRLMKDIVTESGPALEERQQGARGSPGFHLSAFIPLLQERILIKVCHHEGGPIRGGQIVKEAWLSIHH